MMGIRPVFFLPNADDGGSSPEDNNEEFSSWPGVDWEDDGEEKMVARGVIFPSPSPSTAAS